jgi:transcriptional regulator with XRE-family HTH domain
MPRAQSFQRSPELKREFNRLTEHWCKKNRMSLSDLAERCGVSLQYLSHIGRYGRVPSKPILILLALNLELEDPELLFRLADLKTPWPLDSGLRLRGPTGAESGLLSINLDMKGFAATIQEIVRKEMQPKRLNEILGGRPLKVGLNRGQFFLFEDGREGFFHELLRALALALHCELETVEVHHSDYPERFSSGEIDLYGPVYKTPQRLGQAIYLRPFCRVRLAGVARTEKCPGLPALPPPKSIEELGKRPYIVAVHKDAMAHHFAQAELGLPANRIIACELPEEAVERILLSSIPRPAHLILTDAPFARKVCGAHPKTSMLFGQDRAKIPAYDDTIAVRPDWPVVTAALDEALDFLRKGGAIARIFDLKIAREEAAAVQVI